MKRIVKLSASLICANGLNLEKDLLNLHQKNIDYLHLDVMDGHFAPRLGIGTYLISQLGKYKKIPLEAHLMVDNPQDYVSGLADAGVSIITIHYEISGDVYAVVQQIRRHNMRVGIALRAYTPVQLIEPFLGMIDMVLLMAYSPGELNQQVFPDFEARIRDLADMLALHDRENIDIAVDGGIDETSLERYKASGANFFILGTSGLFVPEVSLTRQMDRIREVLSIDG